jgi:hypothetical protein
MITDKGHQCDACSKYADTGDTFYKFACTKIATKSDPLIPARLLLCPSCKQKIAKAFHIVDGKMKINSMSCVDLSILPAGRLKRILTTLQTKSRLRDLQIF